MINNGKIKKHFYKVFLKTDRNPLKKIKNIFICYFIRPFYKPENFFYFPSKQKSDYYIDGHHNSCSIRIFKSFGESKKTWQAFIVSLVFLSRNNKK